MKKRVSAVLCVGALLCVAAPLRAELDLKHKWVYCSQNLLVDRNVDSLLPLMERIRKAGYNGILLADYKFCILDRMDRRYFSNARRVIVRAKELDLEIVPGIFPIGYSNGVLAHDPNLIEGHPVKDAPFEIRGGRLVPLMPEGVRLQNGDFETLKNGRFDGWWQENVGKSVHADHKVIKSGKVSVRMQDIRKHSPQHGHCRLHQLVRTEPFKAYHLSVWMKTKDFDNPRGVKLTVLAGKHPKTLQCQYLRLKRTQDWTQHHVVFNSHGNTEVRIYCGVWKGEGGTLWWDGLKMEPLGFVNVIRRDACPVKLRSPDGKTVYAEGRDVDRIVDPKLGHERWPGTFASWHTPPTITIPGGSRLKEGDHVFASYYHPVIVHNSQVACSLIDPKVFEVLDDQMKRVHELFGAKSYMMSHDEIRSGGWTPDYANITMGEALATNVRKCFEIVRKHAPAARVYVWSDMFDPNHNARADYYLCKTTFTESWKGLSRDVIMVDWYARMAPKAMAFFGGRGHEQIMAGYYDGNVAANVKQWMDSAKASPAKITGIMYTTWRRDYSNLEEFMEEVRKHE